MDKLRIVEKNKTNAEIKSLISTIKRNNATIERLKSQDRSKFNDNQIAKLTLKVKEDEETLSKFEEKLTLIDQGKLDTVITDDNNVIVNNAKKHRENEVKKNTEKNMKKVQEQEKIKVTLSSNNTYKQDMNAYSISKECEKFFKNSSSIPDYMSGNISDMPNNKGYIWKGIWCFGEIDTKNKHPIIMFEKIRGGNLLIHEISETQNVTYEKNGKNNKKLVSKTYR